MPNVRINIKTVTRGGTIDMRFLFSLSCVSKFIVASYRSLWSAIVVSKITPQSNVSIASISSDAASIAEGTLYT